MAWEALAAEEGVHFVGRLASYKYFNMDQAIRNSLDYFRDVLKPRIEVMKKESPQIVISELVALEAWKNWILVVSSNYI